MKTEANPSSICPKEATRYAIPHPWLDLSDSAKPVLVATDGKILAVVPVSDVCDETSGPVPKEALRDAFKVKGQHKGRVEANGKAVVYGTGATYVRPDAGCTMPDWRQIVPKCNRFTVCLDANLLAKLQDVLEQAQPGLPGVMLSMDIDADGKVDTSVPILVQRLSSQAGPIDGTAAFGVIMPISES